MRPRSLLFAALGAAFLLGAAAPAFAQRDDWHRNDDHGRVVRDDHHDRDHRDAYRRDGDHRDWDHRDWDRGAYAPPVVVAPSGGYYAPPVVAYSPGISFGINIR